MGRVSISVEFGLYERTLTENKKILSQEIQCSNEKEAMKLYKNMLHVFCGISGESWVLKPLTRESPKKTHTTKDFYISIEKHY